MRELAAHAQPVWCTSWNHLAAGWIAPRLGMPDTWPHVPVRGGVRFGRQSKLGPLYAWAGRRPLAVLDDEFGGKDPPFSAAQRTAEGAPTLLRPVNPYRGLCRDDVDAVLAWLRQL